MICKMGQQELEVTVISAQDLKNVSMFGKMTPYAVAWVEPRIEVSTPIACKGGVNPTWNALLKLIVDQRILNQPNAILHIDIYNPRYMYEDLVGSCSVSLSCLKEKDSNGADGEQFMSREVHRPSGRTQGWLDFSLKLGDVYQPPAMPGRFAPVPQTVSPVPCTVCTYAPGGSQHPQCPPQYSPRYPESYPSGMGPTAPDYPPAGQYDVPPPF